MKRAACLALSFWALAACGRQTIQPDGLGGQGGGGEDDDDDGVVQDDGPWDDGWGDDEGGAGGVGGSGGSVGMGGAGGSARVCGGMTGATCGRSEFCDMKPGVCMAPGATGVCVRRTMECPAIFAPVCGCDGKTYGNDCARQGAGVSKLHDGECKANTVVVGEGETCGGFSSGPQRICGDGLFCEAPAASCDVPDAPGRCARVPQACDDVYSPVCGCNGRTYGNDCSRRAARVNLASRGECRAGGVGAACGGFAGLRCREGLTCEQKPGLCGAADVGGMCVEKPAACTKELKPVCGCDGQTYGNDCLRLSAGVPKNHDGACKTQAALVKPGRWGGEHAELLIKDPVAGGGVTFDCGAGNIQGPLELQPDGSFKWPGTYTPGGGPVTMAPPKPATFYGQVEGDAMTLRVFVDGRESEPFKLAFGREARLFLCL